MIYRNMTTSIIYLIGGFNPSEHISQNGNLPQIGVKIKIFETTTQLFVYHEKNQS